MLWTMFGSDTPDKRRRLEERLEVEAHLLGVVHEVEDEGLVLARVGAVEPGKGLHRRHAGEALVHVHRHQLGLVEAGLELVGDQQHVELVGVEGVADVPALEAGVHRVLVELVRPALRVDHVAGEGDQRRDVLVLVLGDVPVHLQLVPDRLLARAGDDHRLGLAAEAPRDVLAEVLDDDLDLLADVVRVQPHPVGDLLRPLGLVHFLVVVLLAPVGDLVGDPVGGVVAQHVEDEALLDGLLHRVDVERHRDVGRARRLGRVRSAARTARWSCPWASP